MQKCEKNTESKSRTKIAFIEIDGNLIMQPLDKNYFKSLAGILGLKGKMLNLLWKRRKRKKSYEGLFPR